MQAGDPPPDQKDPKRSSGGEIGAPARGSGRPSQAPPRPSSPPARPSQPPQPFRAAYRVVFALVWVGAQITLVLTADRRVDDAFGFRLAPDSTIVRVALQREVVGADGQRSRQHVEDGIWSANDAGGLRRRFAWTDRIRNHDLARLDVDVTVSASAAATLAHLQSALDDVATHTADDAETRRFLLDVTVRRNGREPTVVHLASAERAGGGS